MFRSTAKLALAVTILAALAAAPAHPTTLLHRTAADQIDLADLVFVGTVVGSETVPTGDHAFAFTFVTFEVEETLKGSTDGPQLTLQLAGGQVGTEIFEVQGLPTFTVGQRHLLFVAGNGERGCPLVGWDRGKLDFEPHPLTGETLLVDFAGRAVAGIENGRWQHSGLALTRDGLLREPAEPGVRVLSQDGVEITMDTAPNSRRAAAEPAVPAARVLSALRDRVRARSSAATFRTAPSTRSASPRDVPATFQFQAHPGAVR